jgi:hypothetical protein
MPTLRLVLRGALSGPGAVAFWFSRNESRRPDSAPRHPVRQRAPPRVQETARRAYRCSAARICTDEGSMGMQRQQRTRSRPMRRAPVDGDGAELEYEILGSPTGGGRAGGARPPGGRARPVRSTATSRGASS